MTEVAEEAKSGTRWCSKCRQDMPNSHFLPKQRNWWCRACRAEYAAEYRAKNKDKIKAKKREFYSNPSNRRRLNVTRRKYRESNKHVGIAERLRLKYGISMSRYASMLEMSNGICAICRKDFDRPNVDHDHKTGKVRDLLCRKCNSGLGCFLDDTAIMQSAIAYIKKHKQD